MSLTIGARLGRTRLSLRSVAEAWEGSLAVLAKLKDMEFHSRANLERLAELALTVEDELKQKELAVPLSEVYSALRLIRSGGRFNYAARVILRSNAAGLIRPADEWRRRWL